MSDSKEISPEHLDGLEKHGVRFRWRARLVATGQPLSDEEFRALREQHRLAGGERTWEIEHVVDWPQLEAGDSRAEDFQDLRATYEHYPRVREEFALADSKRAWENGWAGRARDANATADAHE